VHYGSRLGGALQMSRLPASAADADGAGDVSALVKSLQSLDEVRSLDESL